MLVYALALHVVKVGWIIVIYWIFEQRGWLDHVVKVG